MRQDAQLELKQDIIQKRRGVCGNLKLRRFRRKEMMDEWGGVCTFSKREREWRLFRINSFGYFQNVLVILG